MIIGLTVLAGLTAGVLALVQQRALHRIPRLAAAFAQVMLFLGLLVAGANDPDYWLALGGACVGTIVLLVGMWVRDRTVGRRMPDGQSA